MESCTVLSLTLRHLGLLLDDLFLHTVSWDLRVIVDISFWTCSTPAGRRVSNSVHVHTLLDELNCHSGNLSDDLPSPISGTLKMFSIASHRSTQQSVARAWCNLLVTSAFDDWSFRMLLVKGPRADPVRVSQASSLRLWPPLITVADSVSSRVLVGESNAHDQGAGSHLPLRWLLVELVKVSFLLVELALADSPTRKRLHPR